MSKKKLTREDMLHLARLSKLQLTEEEIEKYLKQLDETVEYVENLDELNTENVEPTNQVTNLTNVFFEDGQKNERGLSAAESLKNAKKKKNNMFVVDRIM
jgi:aspartyl-tRNA(Asn)/glutamyl-tRNA(Gln) amidotransferase subunit C